jgi:glutamyl-tRNA synthetase
VEKVRVRFAPSPTGHLHIGSLRTALFNWLFARHNNGQYLVRIEDTDIKRSHEKFVDSILSSLEWAQLTSDEPPVFQSERTEKYKEAINQLLSEGKAYRCFCPATEEQVGRDYLRYEGHCRIVNSTAEEEKKPHVIRFKLPDQKTISFNDLIRGPITFSMDQFDDFILVRTDGTPVYNFVVVVDDADMNITHVIRGEDHISNTPKQIFLYHAFGWPIPFFAHMPLILGPSGQRLSKREAATSVTEYIQDGYLADALCNYLARLGWSHGDQEIFSREELIKLFTLKEVGKSGAIFDQAKLDWMNGHYIRETDNELLLNLVEKNVDPDFLKKVSSWSADTICIGIGLYKDRVNTLKQLVNELIMVHDDSRKPTKEEIKRYITYDTVSYIKDMLKVIEVKENFTAEELKSELKELVKKLGIKFVQVAQPLRLALIGSDSGPGVFELLALLGKTESIKRINQFVQSLKQLK